MEEQIDGKQAVQAADNKTQIELELGVPRTLRTEFNFLKFPFFDLARNSGRPKIKIEEWVETDEGTFQILWQVTRDIEAQFPGDFEKRLHRAIEQIINASLKPIKNPLRLGSLRYIARLMGINESGKNLSDIQRAFNNIVSATIKANGTFQLKESKSKKRTVNDTFHLYDRVVFMGEQLPSGQTADCVYLMLGSWYLNNINNHYVVPLDWQFYNKLPGTITTRMYEFLSIHFFAALEYGRAHHDVRYSRICDYFPLTPQYPLWKAKKQLKQAHESLLEASYCSKIEWRDANERQDWLIRYAIGARARAEYERNKSEIRHIGSESRQALIPSRRRKQKAAAQEEPPIAKELIERGITRKIALQLVEDYSEDQIRNKVAVFDWLREHKRDSIRDNPAGFLRKSIEENYTDPAGFESKEEQEERAGKTAEAQQKRKWDAKVEDYKKYIQTPTEQLIVGELLIWQKYYQKENHRQPTEAEIEAKRQELIEGLPTDLEVQEQIFGKIMFKAKTLEPLERTEQQ